MKIGDQIVAPEGFLILKKGVRYSFLKNDRNLKFVTLVEFTNQEKGRRVQIHRLDRESFERGSLAKDIVMAEPQFSLPPWLSSVEGASLDQLDLDRSDFKKTNRERTELRYGYIFDLISRVDEILAANNPFSIINKHAKLLSPKQNRTRLAEWFFSYVCYGRNLIALYPEFPNIGLWSRNDPKYSEAFLGRESLSNGRKFGFPSAQFSEQINKSYLKRVDEGVTLRSIFEDALREDWGCRGRMDKNGKHELYHPEGKPFPNTYGKFRYQLVKNFGLNQIQLALYGKYRVRTKMKPSQGKYTEEIGNLMEQFEADAYYLKERAKSVFSDEPMPRLCVVRGVCGASKCVTGIGFSLEGETAEAYRAMLFSTAIPKDKFLSLFGLKGGTLDWPCHGLPPHPITDRGSAPISAIITNLITKFPVKEMTESYSGQSKPSVEASHPRDIHTDGPPSFVLSDFNLIQLAQREIARAARDNHCSLVGEQILGKRVADEVLPTPYALWKYLDARGRNDSIVMPFDDAVRSFLPKKEFILRHNGVWLEDRCFHSAALDKTGVRDQLKPSQEVIMSGYTLSMCLLYVWVEVGNQLIELKQVHPYRDGENEKFVSLEYIQEEAKAKRKLESAFRSSNVAASVEASHLFKEATGLNWSPGKRIYGKPKKYSKVTRLETNLLKPIYHKRRTK